MGGFDLKPAARRAALLALAFGLGATWPALAQVAGPGTLAVRSDGFLFWIQDGMRHVVYPAALSDDQINALPEGAPLNAALQAAGPGDAPQSAALAPQPTGSSRAQRLQLGQWCQCTLIRGPGQRIDLAVRVADVQRDAWPQLRQVSPLNTPPRPGYEYVSVSLNVRYQRGPSDLPVSLDRFDLTAVDWNEALYSPAFVIEARPIMNTTAYPGSEIDGTVTFQVPRDSQNLSMVWRYNDEGRVWFALVP
jgi:hypothetical protein